MLSVFNMITNMEIISSHLSPATVSATPLSSPFHRHHFCIPQAHKLLSVGGPPLFNSCSPLLQVGFSSGNHPFFVSPAAASSPSSLMALGSDTTSVDTDDMFDDLVEKHGKVVFRSSNQKSAAAEIDDEAESLSFAVSAAEVASEVKAGDIKVLFVKPLVYWTRFFIIATAFSRPQMDAIRTKIRDMAEDKFGRLAAGDSESNSWTLLDFGDVVVHIFLPQQRAFYNLEEFYGNATVIELPFES